MAKNGTLQITNFVIVFLTFMKSVDKKTRTQLSFMKMIIRNLYDAFLDIGKQKRFTSKDGLLVVLTRSLSVSCTNPVNKRYIFIK